MNKNIILLIGIAIVIVGIIVYFMSGNPLSNKISTDVLGEQLSLKDLVAMGGSQKCTIDSSNDASMSSGIVYMGSDKMRGDFTSISDGKTFNSHMIVDDSVSYVWTDEMNVGIKTSIDAMSGTAQNSESNNIDVNQKANYRCESWSPDSSLFNLPSGINFTDLSAMMGQIPNTQSGDNTQSGTGASTDDQAMCAACDSVPESARVQCRTALGCN
jgi:hypothetical protein